MYMCVPFYQKYISLMYFCFYGVKKQALMDHQIFSVSTMYMSMSDSSAETRYNNR